VPDAHAQTELKHIRLDRFFPGATEVGVAGSFNGWQPAATPMERLGIGCGQRKVDLYLKPGRYEYRFVADGNWTDDPFGGAFVANPFGTRNSVLVVSGGKNQGIPRPTGRRSRMIISNTRAHSRAKGLKKT
jgi:1,4-alpha-glucan branching enzyme